MLAREWLEAVRRDHDHPSVIIGGSLKESWDMPDLDRSAQQRSYVQTLYQLTPRSPDAVRDRQ